MMFEAKMRISVCLLGFFVTEIIGTTSDIYLDFLVQPDGATRNDLALECYVSGRLQAGASFEFFDHLTQSSPSLILSSSLESQRLSYTVFPNSEHFIRCDYQGNMSNFLVIGAVPSLLHYSPVTINVYRNEVAVLTCPFELGNLHEYLDPYDISWEVFETSGTRQTVRDTNTSHLSPDNRVLYISISNTEDTRMYQCSFTLSRCTRFDKNREVDTRCQTEGNSPYRGSLTSFNVFESSQAITVPENEKVLIGEVADFTCSAFGSFITISWQFDDCLLSCNQSACDYDVAFVRQENVSYIERNDNISIHSTLEINTSQLVDQIDEVILVVCILSQHPGDVDVQGNGRTLNFTSYLTIKAANHSLRVLESSETSQCAATLHCTGAVHGEGYTVNWYKNSRAIVLNERIHLADGELCISDIEPSDEAIYKCCQPQICSPNYSFYAPLKVNPTLSSNLTVYMNDSLAIPCGILKGSLTTNFLVEWDITTDQDRTITPILVYRFSQGNQIIMSGNFSYDPANSVLHVANFLGYENSQVQITCTLVTGRGGAISRSVDIAISHAITTINHSTATTAHQSCTASSDVTSTTGPAPSVLPTSTASVYYTDATPSVTAVTVGTIIGFGAILVIFGIILAVILKKVSGKQHPILDFDLNSIDSGDSNEHMNIDSNQFEENLDNSCPTAKAPLEGTDPQSELVNVCPEIQADRIRHGNCAEATPEIMANGVSSDRSEVVTGTQNIDPSNKSYSEEEILTPNKEPYNNTIDKILDEEHNNMPLNVCLLEAAVNCRESTSASEPEASLSLSSHIDLRAASNTCGIDATSMEDVTTTSLDDQLVRPPDVSAVWLLHDETH